MHVTALSTVMFCIVRLRIIVKETTYVLTYLAKRGYSALKDVGINGGEPPKWGALSAC